MAKLIRAINPKTEEIEAAWYYPGHFDGEGGIRFHADDCWSPPFYRKNEIQHNMKEEN